ncbi:MAG: hypothetical protein AVDCRST_MAG73-630 [uncultured Thermomicrobiales bacterium]|uniref:Lipid/polyisoprenoid-binding YceI-like domain-containing protein n=1 Tax=uncultured Thermomicrobiales bacterium TaxID=1645740 RepID=A0A6J4TPW9_9BACT|nr:MAG: hypothetical protein AVDCRST_MAG73-630 [uncultured Thermomicrobiales bacterium]
MTPTPVAGFRRHPAGPVAGLLGLALVLGFVLGGATPAVLAQDDAPTPTPGVLGTPTPTDPCAVPADQTPTPLAEGTETYAIVSEESKARYRVEEELVQVGATEAVGETAAIIGQILFDAEGMPLACSRFDVDLRTLQSDEARRDNYLYNNTLETEQFPLATFVLTGVEGLDGPLADGEETAFTLIGNLTVHGVTNLISWEATVTRDGDDLSGSALTRWEMPQFAIEPPRAGPVVSLDETVQLEVDIVAKRAEG